MIKNVNKSNASFYKCSPMSTKTKDSFEEAYGCGCKASQTFL
jgi:hypothetical protein